MVSRTVSSGIRIEISGSSPRGTLDETAATTTVQRARPNQPTQL